MGTQNTMRPNPRAGMPVRDAAISTALSSPEFLADFDYERRSSPRAALSVEVSHEGAVGRAIDFSESGLSFATPLSTLPRSIDASIQFDSEIVPVRFETVWQRPSTDSSNKIVVGGRFVDLGKERVSILRKHVILAAIQSLLSATNGSFGELIHRFFLDDIRAYLTDLQELVAQVEAGRMKSSEAELRHRVLTDSIMQKADVVERALDSKIVIRRLKERFRTLTGPWAYKSAIVKRAFDKPRGYPGDHKLLELIYDEQPISDNIMGSCFDRYFLSNEYAVAVRNRKDYMKGILREFLSSPQVGSRRILNVACGSCREVRELLLGESGTTVISQKAEFVCLDQDPEALEFSRRCLSAVPHNASVAVNFIQHDVVTLAKKSGQSQPMGTFGLIYSIGLADYLPERLLKCLIEFCIRSLEPAGKLVIAHKDIGQYKPLPPNWFCDWNFYPRDEETFLEIVRSTGVAPSAISAEREPSRRVVFFTVKKPDR